MGSKLFCFLYAVWLFGANNNKRETTVVPQSGSFIWARGSWRGPYRIGGKEPVRAYRVGGKSIRTPYHQLSVLRMMTVWWQEWFTPRKPLTHVPRPWQIRKGLGGEGGHQERRKGVSCEQWRFTVTTHQTTWSSSFISQKLHAPKFTYALIYQSGLLSDFVAMGCNYDHQAICSSAPVMKTSCVKLR